jgi:hypothetical protein
VLWLENFMHFEFQFVSCSFSEFWMLLEMSDFLENYLKKSQHPSKIPKERNNKKDELIKSSIQSP